MFLLSVLVGMFLLTYIFARFWLWMLGAVRKTAAYRRGMLAIFMFSYGLSLASYILIRSSQASALHLMAFWLVVLMYTIFAALTVVLLYWLLRKWLPESVLGRVLRIGGLAVFAGVFGVSVYNAYTPVVRHASITLDKPLAQPLRIGLASDLHIGSFFGANQLDKLSDIMHHEKVDMIMLAGDIMDDSIDVYLDEHMQPSMMKLRAPLGTYAVLGNHDLLGWQEQIYDELTKAGIKVLNDEAVPLDDGRLWLIGRLDDNAKNRLPIDKLLLQVEPGKPVILMEHRPTEIVPHSRLPIDIQFSGHTHNGQIFPANLLAAHLNRLAYGYEKIGLGHYFVTSGYGFWGVPLRLGSQSEVWIIDVKGKP